MLLPINAGDVIADRYVVERPLAHGGMGVVVLARHRELRDLVAIKLLLPQIVASTDAVARFMREARAAALLKNEHVVRVFDVGRVGDDIVYMAMEYLEGSDLDQMLRSRGPLPAIEAVDYVIQACAGVAEAHRRGVVHRDLKPANLFISRRSDGSPLVKLLDFGISKYSPPDGSSPSVTKTSVVMGSPLYMSPEQLRSTRSVDHRTDIWSLGVVLYEAICGRTPFAAESFPEICARILTGPPDGLMEGIPGELGAVIFRCLEKLPEDRFVNVADLAMALRPFASAEGQSIADRVERTMRVPLPPMAMAQSDPAPPPSAANGSSPELPPQLPNSSTAASFTSTHSRPGLSKTAVALLAGGGGFAALVVVIALVALIRPAKRGPEAGNSAAESPNAPALDAGASKAKSAPSTAGATVVRREEPAPAASLQAGETAIPAASASAEVLDSMQAVPGSRNETVMKSKTIGAVSSAPRKPGRPRPTPADRFGGRD
jgi:serine/threonine-protein kinase